MEPQRELPAEYSILTAGDAVVPTLLYGTQQIEIPVPEGALPETWQAGAEDVFQRSAHEDPPGWLSAQPLHVLLLIQDVLSEVRAVDIDDHTVYAFDVHHRLDEFTFVGRPASACSASVPILAIQLAPEILSDDSGKRLTRSFENLRRRDVAVADAFTIETRELSDLPAHLRTIEPALELVETWRLSSLYCETNVGAPAGSVSLMPGETRKIEITAERTTTSTQTRKSSILEKLTESSKREFKRTFDRSDNRTTGYKSAFTWTGTDKTEAHSSTSTRSWGRDSQRVLKDTQNTVETIINDRVKDVTVSVSDEYQGKDTSTSKMTRSVTLKNTSTRVVTYVYHHLNEVYAVNLDLTRVCLRYTGSGPDDPPALIPLAGNVRKLLPASVDTKHRNVIAKTIAQMFAEHYGHLAIGEIVAGTVTMNEPPADDLMNRTSSRSALTGERRASGPLPVNVGTWQHVIQTPGLHPIPYLSEFTTPSQAGVAL